MVLLGLVVASPACSTRASDDAVEDAMVGADARLAEPSSSDPLVRSCGNGRVDHDEACDDDNDAAGDGCDASCRVEAGFSCDGLAPTACVAVCGDGLVVGDETCDDANGTPGDGCGGCAIEPGFGCEERDGKSVCAPVCGDGILLAEAGEACDDGNAHPGDGCSATCAPEPGYCCDPDDGYCLRMTEFEVVDAGALIPDGTYDGTLESMACVAVEVAAAGNCNHGYVHDVEIGLALEHPRVGELTIKMMSPSGKLTTLASIPGYDELTDGHPERMGSFGVLSAAAPIVFDPLAPGAVDAELIGFGLGDGERVCDGDGRCAFAPNPGAGEGELGLGDFVGKQAGGAWTICVGDSSPSLSGHIDGARLTYRPM